MSAPPRTPQHQPQQPTTMPTTAAAAARDIIGYLGLQLSASVTRTKATREFCLTSEDLVNVKFTKVPKAIKTRTWTHMFEVGRVALICAQKYWSVEGLREKKRKNKAAAEKRKATKSGNQAARNEESTDPKAQALLSSLGLKGVKKINKTWARNLLRLTPKDLEKIAYTEEENHFEGYRSQHMYQVGDLVEACLKKYGDLAGLKAHKAAKPIKTQSDSYVPYEAPPAFASSWGYSGRCCPWPNCVCEAFEAQEDWDY